MSDLAPFVAAVLRDKTIQDMQEEINALREALRQSRAMEITGRNGSPIYAKSQLENGSLLDSRIRSPDSFPQPDAISFSLREFANVEVWIGGTRRLRFSNNSTPAVGFIDDMTRDYENGRGRMYLEVPPIEIDLHVEVGPLTQDEWRSLAPRGDRNVRLWLILQTLSVRFGDRDGFTVSVLGIGFADKSIRPRLYAAADEERGI